MTPNISHLWKTNSPLSNWPTSTWSSPIVPDPQITSTSCADKSPCHSGSLWLSWHQNLFWDILSANQALTKWCQVKTTSFSFFLVRYVHILILLFPFSLGSTFQRIIKDDGPVAENPSGVKKLIFCTGKVYFDLIKARRDAGKFQILLICPFCKNAITNSFLGLEGQIAIATIEQICPFPFDLVQEECNKYSNAELVFCQEEHKNQGAWCYVQPRMQTAVGGYDRRVHYCGREVSLWRWIHGKIYWMSFFLF